MHAKNPHTKLLESRMSYALQTAKMGLWDFDFANRECHWSPETFQLFGIPLVDGPICFDSVVAPRIHPEDLPQVLEYAKRLTVGVRSYDLVYRVIHPSMGIRILHSTIVPDLLIDGSILLGIVRDVTEEKENERRLIEGKQRYESLKKYNPDGIVSVDLNRHIIGSNPAFSNITGYSAEELLQLRDIDLIDLKSVSLKLIEAYWDSEIPRTTIRLALLHKDGYSVPVTVSLVPIVVRNEIIGVYAIVKDLSEQERMESELLHSQRNLEHAEEFAHIGNYERNLVTGAGWWSKELYRIFGVSPKKSITYDDFVRHIHPDDREMVEKAYRDAEQGSVYDVEYRVVRPNGEVRYIHSKSEPQIEDGKFVRIFGFAQDITDRKMADEYQRLLNKSDKLSAIGQLAAGIAHEIRNPLTTLKGFTQFFYQKSDVDSKPYFELMQSELNRIQDILDELLLAAKPQAMKLSIFEINALVHEVLALMSPQAAMQNIRVESQFEDNAALVEGESNRLKQVFINVIKNAFEAMPTKGGILRVNVATRSGSIEMSFTDNGQGIPPDTLARLGEPFYSTKEKGTGLGILVTRRIVELHGGNFSIESQVGQGTTVTISLPISSRLS